MTRTTEHRNLTDDGRDADFLAQCERAATFNASTVLTDRYVTTHPTIASKD